MSDYKELCLDMLQRRGVSIDDIAECVLYLQSSYRPDMQIEDVVPSIDSILSKREVQHAILTGISLDEAAERNTLGNPVLEEILNKDESLYGIDEVLAYGICNLYGSIALTNYGYIDRVKPGIIGKLNSHNGECHTFLDDIVGAIAASAASRMAHAK